MKNIVIFASGGGSNAENIALYFEKKGNAKVVAIFCNNPKAGVIDRAERLNIPCNIFTSQELKNTNTVDQKLNEYKPDVIVLAGFLLLFPGRLLNQYPEKVVNIHPALLPAYGGKGMYGHHVHEAVIANKEKKHGVTVHLVNEEYDKGKILIQESFDVESVDTLSSVEEKIHKIEFRIFPLAIEKLLSNH